MTFTNSRPEHEKWSLSAWGCSLEIATSDAITQGLEFSFLLLCNNEGHF